MASNPMDAIRGAWQPQAMGGGLGITRTRDEASETVVRASDVVIQATKVQSTATTIATVPDGENWRVEYIAAFNGTGGASTLRVFFVPSGGSAGATTTEAFRVSIATLTGVNITVAHGYQMLPGESLQMICTANDDITVFARLTRITQGVAV